MVNYIILPVNQLKYLILTFGSCEAAGVTGIAMAVYDLIDSNDL